ncbi:enolase C-terminal domain-like protein [Subtercola endophyticus]|uniref:enolase C-terminal domain-like protein n=1 Tax=Subtercola endophyticus TaxID=2895559 RepID=UPI001E639F1B|nr:enolase C-terminal domain-like protein [Subtercola endophyticus]UFS60843.1 starvation-sensing protein RspA [Subtercola endophyticus]
MSDDRSFPVPWPSRDSVRITAVRCIVTAPEGIPLVVVCIDTTDDGLHGLGCATFTQRWQAVVAYIEALEPLLVGRSPADIEDLTRLAKLSSYWREGPVGNNAISGIDLALWDIAGKRAGMPVHELLGGRVRGAADAYIHASGPSIGAAVDHAGELLEAGWRNVRIQAGQKGLGAYGAPGTAGAHPGAPYPDGWSVEEYLRQTPELFDRARSELPVGTGLLHDVHSRLTPKQAVLLARRLEPFDLFFLEDVLAPEDWERLPEVRAASPVPIAVGELATSVQAAARLVLTGAVDYLRCHISAIGGLTPGRKLAALAEFTGVRTAWHAPGDTSPVGAAANIALDVTSPAFGIQEGYVFSEVVHEVFPGTLRIVDGWIRPNDSPGWGIELDERAAAAYPPGHSAHDVWASRVRSPDGTLRAP